MNSNWTKCTLGDAITLKRGYDLPNRDRREGLVPIVSSAGISGYHNVAKVCGPGVVTGRYGTLGEVFFVDSNFWPLNTTLYVQDFKGNDPRFVSYFLKTLNLGTQNSAGAVPGVNRNALHLLPVKIPPLPTQRKIANILSAYDDLIENNTRRIAILEEMAQRLYQEWFVHFRYPGHEDVPLVDSELGPIPEGWEVKRLGEVAQNFDSKRRPLSGMQRDAIKGTYPYYGAAKVLDYVNDFLFSGRYLLIAEDGSVITERGTPVLQLVDGEFWVNNHAHVVQGIDPVSTELLYLALNGLQINGYITGAAQPKITQTALNRIPILISPFRLMDAFTDILSDLFDSIQGFRNCIVVLRKSLVLLLPRLVSGFNFDISM